MAAAATLSPAVSNRRRPCWVGTPEIYFTKAIDNSRLVKVEDPQRSREMRQFGIALGCLFILVMVFAWQHFKAIEYGYRIQSMKIQRDGLIEINRALRLEAERRVQRALHPTQSHQGSGHKQGAERNLNAQEQITKCEAAKDHRACRASAGS